MIPEIENTYLRRFALVWTVASYIVCLGPLHLILAVIEWAEDELKISVVAIWRDKSKKETK